MSNNRKTHRENVHQVVDAFVTVGNKQSLKYKLLDLSEGGMRFRFTQDYPAGTKGAASLEFPWLDNPVDLHFTVMHVTKIILQKPNSNPPEESGEPAEPEEELMFDTSCRFDGMTIGMQDIVFRQVARIGRMMINRSQESATS